MRKITKEVTITTYGDFTKTKALLKKFVRIAIVYLHEVVCKLEVYLLEKIENFEIEEEIEELTE